MCSDSTIELKQCAWKEKCIHPDTDNGWLPATLEYFYKSTNNGSKPFRTLCKKCFAQNVENTRDIERRDAYIKHYDETHPEVRQRCKDNFEANHPGKRNEYTRDWYWRNVEEQRERSRNYGEEHHEEKLEYGREYHKNHPERNRIHTLNRQARKRNLPDTLTLEEWDYALRYFGGCCAICGRPEGNGYHIAMDHWVALSNKDCPGTTRENTVPMCHSITKGAYGACNNSKWASLPEVWLKRKFGEDFAEQKMKEIEMYFDHLHSLS